MEELFTRKLSGETSAEENQVLAEWMETNAIHADEYEKLKRVFELSNKYYLHRARASAIDVEMEWKIFSDKIESLNETPIRKIVPLQFQLAPLLKIAAMVVFTALAGYIAYYFANQNSTKIFQTTNQTQNISLPDGSEVMLNRHSELSFSKDFGESNRRVKLTGEGFFKVVPNAKKPFIIEANEALVEVLGTSFSVQAFNYANTMEVIVETGIVKFSFPAQKKEVKLLAGDKGSYSKTSKQLTGTVNTDENGLSWKTHKLIFKGTDLKSVIDIVNRTYGSSISISTSVSVSCAVTATFDQQSLEAVLKVLQNTLNLTIQKEGDRIIIKAAGC